MQFGPKECKSARSTTRSDTNSQQLGCPFLHPHKLREGQAMAFLKQCWPPLPPTPCLAAFPLHEPRAVSESSIHLCTLSIWLMICDIIDTGGKTEPDGNLLLWKQNYKIKDKRNQPFCGVSTFYLARRDSFPRGPSSSLNAEHPPTNALLNGMTVMRPRCQWQALGWVKPGLTYGLGYFGTVWRCLLWRPMQNMAAHYRPFIHEIQTHLGAIVTC